MNKKMKILPIVAMSTLFITGCTVTPEKQSTGNLLLDALNDLEVGDVKKKAADKIFKSNILASSDRNVKKAYYQEDLFTPFWQYGEGQEESV